MSWNLVSFACSGLDILIMPSAMFNKDTTLRFENFQ